MMPQVKLDVLKALHMYQKFDREKKSEDSLCEDEVVFILGKDM